MSETYADCLRLARAELSQARALITEEIASYPTPVAGCDDQYTHLLQERRRIGAALSALDGFQFIPTPRTLTPNAGVESR